MIFSDTSSLRICGVGCFGWQSFSGGSKQTLDVGYQQIINKYYVCIYVYVYMYICSYTNINTGHTRKTYMSDILADCVSCISTCMFIFFHVPVLCMYVHIHTHLCTICIYKCCIYIYTVQCVYIYIYIAYILYVYTCIYIYTYCVDTS